jgi:hypothetical protein
MRAKGSSSPADAGRGGNDADDDAADDDDDGNDDASRVRIIAVSGPPVEGALGAGPKPRPDWAGSGAAATDPNGDAAAPATPNGDGAPKAPVVGDAAAPATPNGDGAPKAPGDGDAAAPATPNGDGAPKAPVGGDVGEPATPNGDGAPPGPGRPAPGPGRNAAVGAVLTWSATSAPTGGLARNRVSHFGQRMRAPSAGTASLATRYFDAQPGQVTIIAEPSMHKERTT